MAKHKPKALDIFCGCGGTTQGLKDAGFDVIASVENDPLAVATYRKNHRRTKVWDADICDLEPRDLLRHHRLRKGQLDLIIGCPPCQAFSSMTRLNGKRRVRDRQSKDLVFEYLRFVEGLNPKVVMIENVPRLIEDYRFKQVRRRLREMGFVGQPTIFDAADFGVPQRRRRMIYIASRVGAIDYAKPVGDSGRATVRDKIAGMSPPGTSGDELHDLPETRSGRIAELICQIPKGDIVNCCGREFLRRQLVG